MKKTLLLLFSNIIIFCFLLFLTEVIIWVCENYRMKIYKQTYINHWPLSFHPGVSNFNLDINHFPSSISKFGRMPVGLNYDNPPIVIFGCSYAYGYRLDENQTPSYKLSVLTKRPVYNRAYPGWGIQHMLYQVSKDDFYKKIPEPEYVIYIMMTDHFRRLYVPTFLSADLLIEDFNLNYKLKNNNLIRNEFSNPFKIFIMRLYLTQKIIHFYINNVILKEQNYNKYSAFALEHFIESKKEMEKHWKNTKYIILFYHKFYNQDKFQKSLEKEGFKVIDINDLTNVNLSDEKYSQFDTHPKEAAWDLIIPALIKKLNL